MRLCKMPVFQACINCEDSKPNVPDSTSYTECTYTNTLISYTYSYKGKTKGFGESISVRNFLNKILVFCFTVFASAVVE